MSATATDTNGKYVQQVEVTNGEILIMYGNSANAAIATDVLVLTPFATADNSVAWRCGLKPAEATWTGGPVGADTGVGATSVDPKYLPANCRA